MKKLIIILLLFASCGTDYEELEAIEARTYRDWQSKEFTYFIDDQGTAVFDGKYKQGAKTAYLIETHYGGQVERNSDLPTFSDKWYKNKKGRNAYALIKVGSSDDVLIVNNNPTIPFFTFEGFRYIFVRPFKFKYPTIYGSTYAGQSFYLALELQKRRIYTYQ